MTALAPDDPRHGKYHTYTVLRCRCDMCRNANTDAARARRARPGRSRDSMQAESLARAKAVKWIRRDHPEVWRRLQDEAYIELGFDPPIRRRRKAAN